MLTACGVNAEKSFGHILRKHATNVNILISVVRAVYF